MTLLDTMLQRMDKAAAHLEEANAVLSQLAADRIAVTEYLKEQKQTLDSLSALPEVQRLEAAFTELDALLENQ